MATRGEQQPRADELAAADEATAGDPHRASCLSRRAVLRAAALTGVGVPLVAACGSGSTEKSSAGASTPVGGGGGGASNAPASTPPAGGNAGSPSGIATTSEVPKGGGLILPQDGVVITQPSAGEFKGFSSTCTHAGCTLDNVSNGTINCICHGSQFSIKDGSVVTGPATAPLPKKPVTVHGKEIELASG
jgi:Rieske Fe-S protein